MITGDAYTYTFTDGTRGWILCACNNLPAVLAAAATVAKADGRIVTVKLNNHWLYLVYPDLSVERRDDSDVPAAFTRDAIEWALQDGQTSITTASLAPKEDA